jgi:hypothetical protein
VTSLGVTTYRLINQSSLVPGNTLDRMAAALQTQAREAASPAWYNLNVNLTVVVAQHSPGDPPPPPAPAGQMDIVLLDDSDVADALGYHDITINGRPYSRVFTRSVLQHGGGVLDGGTIGLSVASVASHEVLESVVDPECNAWCSSGDRLVAFEVCDPVQSQSYSIDGVLVSNWVTANWFVSGAPGPWDRLGKLRGPRTIARGGYAIAASLTHEHQVMAQQDTTPQWRRASRNHPASRTFQRLNGITRPPVPKPSAH